MKKQVFNPYLPLWEYVPDGEPYVFGDRLYVYGSHDRCGGDNYCLNDYVCWSAPVYDLSDWRYDGVIYRSTQDPANPNREMQLFAPDVACGPDGRYYLYYSLSFRNIASVAVCDTPSGQYEYYGDIVYPDGTPLGQQPGERVFDPGVLVEDGQVYLYTGFSPSRALSDFIQQLGRRPIGSKGSTVTELEPDMKTVKNAPKALLPGWENSEDTGFEGHEFFEASSIRKFGELYYLVYSSVQSHELCYATSAFPDRGFRYRGILHSNGDIGLAGASEAQSFWGNNHGSLVQLGEAFYIFGHRQTNAHEFSRQGVAERLVRDGDGFLQAEMTSCGLNGGPLIGRGAYSAGVACTLRSAEGACKTTEAKREIHPYITQEEPDYEPESGRELPVQFICNLCNGSAAGFKYFALENLRQISVEVRGSEGEVICSFSERGKPDAAFTVSIPVSPAEEWQTVFAQAAVPNSEYALTFLRRGEGSMDFKGFTLA